MNLVTILGNTNSGAGAIYEYLIGREDTNDPFNKKEFRILCDPGGINDLYKCYESYSLQSFNDALSRLIKLEKHYRVKRNLFRDGLGLDCFKNYKYYWEEYIKSIQGERFNHRYIYEDIQKNITTQIIKRIASRLRYRKILFKEYFTGVTKREFRDNTYYFLTKIISNKKNNRLYVLNQCGNFSAPIVSTELLGEPKIICVRRNPLDQYTELKIHKGMNCPKKFVYWYLHLKKLESRDQFIDERVLEISFDNFVLNYQNEAIKVCNFLNINPTIKTSYNPESSKKNIGKYKKYLSNYEIDIISQSLSKWIN